MMRRVYKTKSVTERVFTKLRKAISRNELLPGQALNIETLAHDLGVSRTPIREALLMLRQEGLVEAGTRTAFVAGLDLNDLKEIIGVREALEMHALKIVSRDGLLQPLEQVEGKLREYEDTASSEEASKAAEADLEFHRVLVSATGNRRLIEMWDQMSLQLGRFWEAGSGGHQRAVQDVGECLKILEALKQGAEETAAEILEHHLMKTKTAMVAWWHERNTAEATSE